VEFEQLIEECKLKFSYKSLNNPEIYIKILKGEKKMSAELTKEDIFRLFAETDRRFKETEREIKEDFKETDRRLDRRFEETDRRLDRRFEETDRRFKETDRTFRETDKKIKEFASLFTGQWGKLIGALVKPSALKLFRE
jgi:DNA anti-recombination protein RmuC